MNQHNSSDQPWHHRDDHSSGQQQNSDSPPPPPPPGPYPYGPGEGVSDPPYGYVTDPRQDPRWVYAPYDSRDEIREMPYFNGYPEPPDKPRRRGPLSAIILGAGILGAAILLIGLLSQLLNWDNQSNPLQDIFSPSPSAPHVVPDEEGSVESLIEGLDHIHDGIDIDWQAGGQHTGPGLDPGQEVSEAPGVFMVDTEVYQYLGFGTGMVVSSDGLAITNYHVVESSMSVSITMADTQRDYSATVLGRDAERDIAVLQIDTEDPLQVASISPDKAERGDRVAGVGNASGQGYLTSVVGEVHRLNETIHIEPQEPGSQGQRLEGLIMVTADIVPGYSGGPTVDADGQVIGISTAATQETTHSDDAFGYAVPIVSALEVVEQVLNGDDSGSVVIGAGGALGIVVSSVKGGGAEVMEVSPGSAGDTIGLDPGDKITAIDGHEVVNSSFISQYVRDKNPGDQVEITWQTESGEQSQATATLDEAEIN